MMEGYKFKYKWFVGLELLYAVRAHSALNLLMNTKQSSLGKLLCKTEI